MLLMMAWPKGKPRSSATLAKLARPRTSLAERFWLKVAVAVGRPDDCWQWKASLRPDGYGQVGTGSRLRGDARPQPAHQVVWELTYGPIPQGLDVDHACHNADLSCPGGPCAHRACVNPGHLRLTTRAVNVMSGHGFGPTNAARTHCEHGHELTEANSYHRKGRVWRECRRCRADVEARRRQRIKAAAV